MRWREVVLWGLLAVGIVAVYPSLRHGCGAPAIRPGTPVPPFAIEDVRGAEQWSSESLLGHPYAIWFFATWCGPCRSEMPGLARILRERPSLRVFAVSEEPADRVAHYLSSSGLTIPAAGGQGAMFASFGIRSVPTVVVVDEKGRVAYARAGSGAIREGVRRLLDGG